MTGVTIPYGFELPLGVENVSVPLLNRNFNKMNDALKAQQIAIDKSYIARFGQKNIKAGTPAGNGIEFGELVADTTTYPDQTRNNTFCKPVLVGDAGRIEFLEEGQYYVVAEYQPVTGAANSNAFMYYTALGLSAMRLDNAVRTSNYGDTTVFLHGTFYAKVGGILSMGAANSLGLNFGAVVTVSKTGGAL